NSFSDVFALDLLGPKVSPYAEWQTRLHQNTNDFSYGVVATPALADGRLIVPTMLGDVVAIDRNSGGELWRHPGPPGSLRPTHGKGSGQAAFAGSPAVAADLVWVGSADGMLSALDLDSGRQVWSTDLGAPILSGVVPAGDLLFVGTFDGTLHAMW